ncbi:MAG: cell division protein FtsQ/DivIB [Candidatus Muiribacteriaceae bacterium]
MRYYIWKESTHVILKISLLFLLIFIFSHQLRLILKKADIPLLRVNDIEVTGNNLVSTKKILLLSGIRRHENKLRLNISKAKSMIETDPFIKAVGILEKDNVFHITVSERRPFVFLKTDTDTAVLDKEGVVLKTGALLTDYDLPVLSGIEHDIFYSEGDKVTDTTVLLGLEWFNAIPINFWSQISELDIQNLRKIIIYTLDGTMIFVDNIPSFTKKFEFFYTKLLELKENIYRIDYFDLRSEQEDIIYKQYDRGN